MIYMIMLQMIKNNKKYNFLNINQKNWRNILLVNKLVSLMLKDKMVTEMKKFQTVEKSFKKIK